MWSWLTIATSVRADLTRRHEGDAPQSGDRDRVEACRPYAVRAFSRAPPTGVYVIRHGLSYFFYFYFATVECDSVMAVNSLETCQEVQS